MKKRSKIITSILIVMLAIASLFCYEVYISYNNLKENNYTIETEKISENIKIAVISDLHDNELGKNNEKLINKINSIEPDIILAVGDMINKDSQNSTVVTNLMKQLSKDYKVFYSLGNTEEDYINMATSDLINELRGSGVTVLNEEYKDIKIGNEIVRIGGMYNYAFGFNYDEKNLESNKTYEFLSDFQNTSNYKIMMAHRPDSFIFGDASEVWDVDLIVSGHTHGGQVRLPFAGGLYVGDQGYFPEYDKGLFDLNRIKILITSGLGSNIEKLPRFNNVPEVVNLYLTKR